MRVGNLIDLLRERAAAQPTDRAFTFLEAGEQEGAALTWTDVDRRSRAIGAAVQSSFRLKAGATGAHDALPRVLILLPPGVDFVPAFFGVLYGGGIALPAYPPSGSRPDRASARLRGMIADAGVSLVVSSSAVRARRPQLCAAVPELEGVPWLDVDEVSDAVAEAWRVPECDPHTIALLQYTSGSTSAPRGVMVTHGNLLHNLALSAALAGHTSASVAVSWLPVNHDMGLIDGVLQPVFSGFPSYLMAPAAFLQRPARWLLAISRYGATHAGGPNFAYDLCVRRVSETDRESLDLSTWRIAFNGSEPVRRQTIETFHRAFAPCGFRWEAFRPAYGLAESTLLVTSSRPGDEPTFLDIESGRSLVSSGACTRRSDPSVSIIRIVDPTTLRAVGDGAVGEIWVWSGSVALGYWNRPRETAATFNAFTSDGDGPFLRTGDLGCTVDGHLYVTGRIKDILIVRGVKHYPQDLEATAEQAHPAVRPGCCAAFAVPAADGEERVALVAEVEPKRATDDGELRQAAVAIRRAIAETHQLTPAAVALVAAGTLPKTTSGKLQRFLCRDGVLGGEFELLAAS